MCWTPIQAKRSSGQPDASDAKPPPSLSAPVTAAWWLLASKSGGRCSTEAATWLRLLVAAVHLRPPQPCSPPHGPRVARWFGLLTVAGRNAFAASLLEPLLPGSVAPEGKRPSCTKSSLTCAGSSPFLPAGLGPAEQAGSGCSIP